MRILNGEKAAYTHLSSDHKTHVTFEWGTPHRYLRSVCGLVNLARSEWYPLRSGGHLPDQDLCLHCAQKVSDVDELYREL